MSKENDIVIKLNPVSIHFLLDILEHQLHVVNRDPTNAIALYEDIAEQIGDKLTVDRDSVPYFKNQEAAKKAEEEKADKKSSWKRFVDSF